MNALHVFFAEIAVCLAVSAVILVRLQRLLRRLGPEVCERGGAATEFWLGYTQLMMLIAPVLLVAAFSRAGVYDVPVAQLKSSLSLVLLGQFAGLVLVGRAVWKSFVRPEPRPAPPAAAGATA